MKTAGKINQKVKLMTACFALICG